MIVRNYNQSSIITTADIDELRKKIRPGDKVRFQELMSYNEDSPGISHRKYLLRKGTVIKKFPRAEKEKYVNTSDFEKRRNHP